MEFIQCPIKAIYQSSLENGDPTPVDAQGGIGIDDGGVGEVVAIHGNKFVDIGLKENLACIQTTSSPKKHFCSLKNTCPVPGPRQKYGKISLTFQ